jgi:hypothetical protein
MGSVGRKTTTKLKFYLSFSNLGHIEQDCNIPVFQVTKKNELFKIFPAIV